MNSGIGGAEVKNIVRFIRTYQVLTLLTEQLFLLVSETQKHLEKSIFASITKSRKASLSNSVFRLTPRSPLYFTFPAVILSRKTLISQNLSVL